MPDSGRSGSRLRTIAGSVGLLACFAAVGLWIGLAPGTETEEPALWRVAAHPLGTGGDAGVVAAGFARAGHLRVQYADGCRGVRLAGRGLRQRRFTIAVRPNRRRCAQGAVGANKVRISACTGRRCVSRLVAIAGVGGATEAIGGGNGGGTGGGSATKPGTPPPPDTPPPPPPPAPFPSACEDEAATEVDTAAELRAAVEDGEDVCVVAAVGNVDLGDLGESAVLVSSEGGSMGAVDLGSTTDLTLSRARFRSIVMRGSHRSQLLGNTIGGTPANRVDDQLIFMPETSNDVTIEGNDIGWTVADDSGNTGYGCRCYGNLNRLRFVGNWVHDIAADGFQGVGGTDVLIDRNEIGPVGRNPGSSEHSDNIQITGNGPNLRITNNWIHHQGYYDGAETSNSGSVYIHGGSTGSLLFENNLVQTALGRTEVCGLGTGGTSRSNITIRRNTWVDQGREFTGFPGFEWDCSSGSGNLIERNVAVDPDGGFAGSESAAAFNDNLWATPSQVSLDAEGNCTSASCNPAGAEPIGYRKPAGVRW